MRIVSSPIPGLAVVAAMALCSCALLAQQTLGGITGEVTDSSGGVIPNVTVTVVDEQTSLTRSAKSNGSGVYAFVNLPIGAYTITYTADGFDVQRTQHIAVQANRTATVNASLKVGKTSETIEVQASPLMNAVDTTNGYVMDTAQIESVPLATGSFTGLATQSAGVSAELGGGTGANSGLGNAPIWANGQRDTSNSFLLNGVDASNLFNGKSTSQVASARVINSTGVQTSPGGGGGVIPSAASIYLSIGNAIPTPAPETITEVRVNASMYDAQQGSTSGAHIDLSTASGTNAFHGTAYVHRGTDWLNAAPFFFNQDPDVPANDKVPQLHRYVAGGTAGGTLIKDKLFYFLGYQHLHVSDAELGDSFLDVPVGLSDDRSASGVAAVANNSFGTSLTSANVDPLALVLFNSPSLPGQPGKWLIPNDTATPAGIQITAAHLDNAFIPGTGRFTGDLAVADLDFNASSKDTLSMKYFYQHDPTVAPYSYSSVPGFDEHLDSGAQVASIINTLIVKSNLSTTETLGILREKNWGENVQPFGPSSIPGGAAGTGSINVFGSNYFPGISIYNVLGSSQPIGIPSQAVLNIGPNAESQSANTGVFENRLAPSGDAIWTLGKHTLSFGGSYTYTQLNTIDKRTGMGSVATDDFSQMIQGQVLPGSSATGFYVTSFLQGNASRYYRANQLGTYLQDKWQITPTLSLTAGVRYDWDGGMTEKYGRIFNFDSTLYSYSAGSDTITNPGLIIAGNNANGTKGVSNTTLTGRQWGIGPRVGAAWQPGINHNKVVIRTGAGIYYDRGELFSYFSPGYAIGTVTGGPFGVNQQLPFVNVTTCPTTTEYFYEGYLATCGGTAAEGNLENPYGTTPLAPPSSPKASDLSNYLPNAFSILNTGSGLPGVINNGQPISLGVYDRSEQAALYHQLHAGLPVAAAPRPGHRHRLRGQRRPTPGHSRAIQPAEHRFALQPRPSRHPLPAELQLRLQRGRRLPRPRQRHGHGLPGQLRGRQRRPARSLHRLRGRVHLLPGRRRGRLQRTPGAHRKAHEPRHPGGRLLHLVPRPGRAERPGPLLQRQQSAQPAQRLRFVRLRPHPRLQLELRLPGSRFRQQEHPRRQGHRRLVAGGRRRDAERPALQRHRLLRLGGQHLLLHRRRHHQPGRPAGQGLHCQERSDQGLRRMVPGHGRVGLEARVLHHSPASGWRPGRRHPRLRSLRDRLYHRAAQHLPPVLPEAR